MACPYAFIFGTPEKGAHSTRIFGFALVDTIGTILLAILSTYFTKTSFLHNLLLWFVLGEVLHYVFGAQTKFLTTLGISTDC